MKNEQIREALDNACTTKVKVCTKTYCAVGCLDPDFSQDYKIRLFNAKVEHNNDFEVLEYKDSLVICDENIINFEPYNITN